jgi:predicted secreted Zn-dependent protease
LFARYLLAGAVALAAASPLAAETTPESQLGANPNVVVAYYVVHGASYKEIKREMDAGGPTDESGKRWAGHAYTEVSYNWPRWSDGRCELDKAEVSYKIHVLLPRLAPGTKLEGSTGSWWVTMRHNLELHELDHVRLSLGYLKEMERAIKAADCATATDAAQKVWSDLERSQALYDERTAHGTRVPGRTKSD